VTAPESGPAGAPGGATGRPLCVLIGPPGAGKTTIGELIAARVGVPFRDTDADIERIAGKSISDIFLIDGEARFRLLERQAVADALATCTGVLAVGGGAVIAEETRRRLAGHTVVFLSVELSDAVGRVGLAASRPLLAINPRAHLKFLLDQRRPLYREVATVTVLTDARAPEDIADEVLGAVAARASQDAAGDAGATAAGFGG
jgi:shikimate kinase